MAQVFQMTTATTTDFSMTPSAAARIAALLAEEANPAASYFRVGVLGGGCAGFQYQYDLSDAPLEEDDRLIELNGARVVIDTTSLELIAGSALDYVEDLVGAAFEMKNPKAASGCGCGNSFSIAL
jgi:iron-sulfur cluster insertion protein